ncbi:TetR/AcrR family transcriptional regulator [Slackia heliotrinireducens]|uniref:HTH tetR-type domain-containing protein n=1 Tax=Slackia heliotrinireducens (strain ATCC 29202 / DSM 20476 / NCTC 11029 / RHS 1) TaxID=471855 RepID=C7N2V2_SLAHD|nr:TetR/AcrR family transcriptional regulator [Slackia heliotrinireducens]ACV21473.1 hypothetical protein Shel_04120 [Slackia heliotrinireducens DSM 20476]
MRKRPDKTAQTKAEFREAFLQLYATTPINKMTVGQVCERAGYNRGTFYLHYQDLYDVLEQIENDLLDGMTACVEACMKRLSQDSSKLSCIAACADVVAYYERNKDSIAILLGENGDPAFVHRLKNNLKPLWRTYVVGESAERSEAELDLALEFALTGTLYMISEWLSDSRGVSAYRLAHLVYDFSIRDVRRRSEL